MVRAVQQQSMEGFMVMSNKWYAYFSVILKASLLITLLSLTKTVHANGIDQIAAVVNSDVIMLSEVKKRARLLVQVEPKARGLAPQALLRESLDDLILERLQVQQAKERGIEIDDVTLNRTVERIAQKNKMNLSQFRQALAREGINYENYREQTRNKMIADALRKRQVDARIRVNDQEIEDLIVSQSGKLNRGIQYQLQHILISAPSGTSVAAVNAAKKRAEAVRNKIVKGADFTTVAKTSSDSNAAQKGGNLGWQPAEKLPASFNRVLTLLEVGAVSEVVRDPQGFHILKLVNKKGGQQSFDTTARVKHILIKVDNKTNDAAARQKINKIYKQLQSGGDFAKLAKQNSDDTGSAKQGGDLGWVSASDLVPQFARVMNSQALNTISAPFKSQFGWHVLSVSQRKKQDRTDDRLKLKAQEFLGNRKLEEEYLVWLQRLKDEAYIEYRPPFTKGIRLQ
jgi:peptidyl-prolyl cis-trans isomerase SurA